MANLFKKIWSGLDFWDKAENQQQRQQFAKEDEEERRRRARDAIARGQAPEPGTVVEPEQKFDFSSPLSKIGSQSQFQLPKYNSLLERAGDAFEANSPQDIAKRKAAGQPETYEEQTTGGAKNFIRRNLTPKGVGNIVKEVARGIAKTPEDLARTGLDIGLTALEKIPSPGQEYLRSEEGKLFKEKIRSHKYENPVMKFLYGDQPTQSHFKTGEELTGAAEQFTGKDLKKASPIVGASLLGLDIFSGGKVSKAGRELAEEGSEQGVKKILQKYGISVADDAAKSIADNTNPKQIEGIVKKQGEKLVPERIVSEDKPEIPGTLKKVDADETPSIEVAPGIKSTNLVKKAEELDEIAARAPTEAVDDSFGQVPNNVAIPENQLPLMKATDQVEEVAPEVPIADFRNAINVPLQKAVLPEQQVLDLPPTQTDVAEQVAKGDIPVPVDEAGNPVLIPDAEAQRQLADQGVVPERGASPVATGEAEMAQAAEQVAKDQVNLEDAAAPRTRTQVTNRINDEDLRADVLENFPEKATVNIEETQNVAKQKINDLSDEELVARFGQDAVVDTPEGYFTAVESIRRLERLGTPESEEAIRRAVDSIAEFASGGGQRLRVVQTLFEDMPTTMKINYLMDKLGKAGAELGDVERARLTALIEGADVAADKLRVLEAQAQDIIDSGLINNKSLPTEVREQVKGLVDQIAKAREAKEMASGQAWQEYQRFLPKTPLGKRTADVGRTVMLSAPSGRAFDILSTTATSIDDVATGAVSNLIGKVLNKIPGVAPGKFSDVIVAPRKLDKGFAEGVSRTAKSFKGEDHVEDFLDEAKRATRGDISTGGGPIRRIVRAAVEAPTNLSRGLREQALFREGVKEAKQRGLKGKAAKTYAELRASIPTKDQTRDAIQAHLRANMLHDNKISRGLNQVARSLDKGGKGWGAVFIRNQVAPFTSWLGGNLHRTLTDKNVLWNVGSAIKNATDGNWQGVVDDVAKFGVNSGEAYAAGMLLTKAGIITTEDANGDNYGGLYFHIGDRYIPVAAAGTFSVPIVWGNSIQQAIEAAGNDEDPARTFFNTLATNTLKNTGVASVFGGENNLQSTFLAATREGGDAANAASQYLGELVRQYIPGITGDINALLDQGDEAPETKVTYENAETGREKTDVMATEINKTKARIPGLSQTLPRKEGTNAKDILDRILKGNQESGTQVSDREKAQSKEDLEKGREERGIPKTDDGIQAAIEEGDWDKAIEGYNWELERAGEDEEVSEKTKQGTRDKIKALEVTRDGDYDPAVIELYKGTGLEEWRDMGDPDSESYDPDTFALLAEYDEKRAKAGVSEYDKDHKKTRYYSKDSKRGGSKGSAGKTPKIVTSIAKQDSDYSFRPLKAQGATFGPRKSAIPIVQAVPNYDRSKLKKISVTRGAKA